MRYSALENDIGLDACQTAGGVEGAAGHEAGIQHKERLGGEAGDLDRSALSEHQRRIGSSKQVYRL